MLSNICSLYYGEIRFFTETDCFYYVKNSFEVEKTPAIYH